MRGVARRGFLAVLAGAPAAAQALGRSLNVPSATYSPDKYADAMNTTAERVVESRADILASLARLKASRGERASSARNQLLRGRLDTDLASYRSFSESAKVRLQAERVADREIADESGWLEERLKRLVGLG